MLYKKFHELELSALGLGTMRLPIRDGENSKIDEEKTAEMIEYAIKNGVNYFDTAYGYHGGESELVVGKCLEKYPRESFYLATKFPGYDIENLKNVKRIFARQLEKCRVDYFDFYLVHTVSEYNIDAYLDPKYGLHDMLVEEKKNGRIKHIGFSIHATLDTMKRFLSGYGDIVEFCQVQFNWIDYDHQKAKDKLALLAEQGIPVWVMEPLRGGKLAKLEERHAERLFALRPDATVPEWSFRYLQSFPEVTVTLSGMSNMDQLRDNIKTFESEKPLSEAEIAELYSIAHDMLETVPCTACRYCTEYCPMQLDIPELIKPYNALCFSGSVNAAHRAIDPLPEDKRPSACIGCRSCEKVCPQFIKISEVFADFTERLK